MNTNAQPDREKEIFEQAVEISPPEEQRAFLNLACDSDPVLRARVDSLLRAHADASQFLGEESAPGTIGLTVPDEEKLGTFIGRYKLLEKIGEGGFGVVYMAEQREPVKRKVALKIIKVGMDTREVVARFETERQALALMDHPNIAKILDGGVTGDVAAGVPPAVEPGVTPGGMGVTGSSALERSQPDPGGKMPPSTAGGTPAATLAAGRPYFVMELVRGIRITDYCAQKNLSTRQRLDLFIAVCHAVQHAHQKGIIHRDLKPSNILVIENDGVPVPKVIDFGIAKATAQRLTEKTVFTQFAQFIGTPAYMSPEQVAMTSVDIDTRSDIYSLGVLLYELLTGTTPFDAQELLKAGFDEMRRVIRETEPERPSTRLMTRKQLRKWESGKVRETDAAAILESHLPTFSPAHLPAASSPTLNPQLKPLSTDLDWIVMKCLEKDRARRYETANGLAADIQRHLSNEPVVARPPSMPYRFQKLVRRNKVTFAAGSAVAAALIIGLSVSVALFLKERAAYSRALVQQQRAEGAEKEAAEKAAVASAVNDFLQWDLLSMADGAMQADEGWRAKADLTVVEALDRAAQRAPGRFKDKPVIEAGIRHALGIAYKGLGDPFASLPHLERALELRTARLGLENPDTIDSLWQLGVAYHEANRFQEALPVLEKALRLSQAARPTNDPATLKILHILGSTYKATGQLNSAIPWLEEALGIAKVNAARTNLNRRMSLKVVGEYMIDLGAAYAEAGRRAEARTLYEEGLKALRANTISDHPNILIGMQNLALLDLAEGNTDQAATRFEEVLQVRKIRQGLEHPETLETIRGLALLYGKLGRTAEAEALHRESIEITRKLETRKPDRTSRSLASMGNFYEERNRFTEAEPFYREALQLARKALTNDAPTLETRVRDLADSLYRQSKYAEAEPLYREAIQSQTARYPTNHDNVLGTTASLARLLADWSWDERSNSVAADVRRLTLTSKVSTANRENTQSVVTSTAPLPWHRAVEAERLLRECLNLRSVDKRVSRGRLGDTKSRLGAAVLSVAFTKPAMSAGQRTLKLHEAETLLLSGHDLMQQSTSVGSKYKRDSLEWLVRLYTAWPRPAEAAAWKQKLEAFEKSEAEKKPATAREAPQ